MSSVDRYFNQALIESTRATVEPSKDREMGEMSGVKKTAKVVKSSELNQKENRNSLLDDLFDKLKKLPVRHVTSDEYITDEQL